MGEATQKRCKPTTSYAERRLLLNRAEYSGLIPPRLIPLVCTLQLDLLPKVIAEKAEPVDAESKAR